MKIFPRFTRRLVLLFALASVARAQVTDPRITSWVTANSAKYARVYETTSDKSSGNAVSTWPRSGLTNGGGGQSTNAYSEIQRVAYSSNYVYVQTTGYPSYTMGNWLTPNGTTYTSWPANRAAIHRIPRNPSIPTTKQKNNGSGGVLVNGVYVWQNGDAQSYSNSGSTASSATISMSGDGIWNRLAGVAETFNFDPANGHQPSNGAYHNHINPKALRYQLGDNVTYDSSSKSYSESGTPTKHSPIIGWANDGLPIYGPYGYATATDSSSAIRRMTSGFVKRDATNAALYGVDDLAVTGRHKLPVWAASVQGKSQTLSSSEYGPTTTATYALGPTTKTCSVGTFAEDYEYLGDFGKTQGVDFDLNRQNVRYCVTPEFPSGTYAYFVCIDASGNTVFPDVINQEYFGSAAAGQGTVNSISESVTECSDAGPAAAITVTTSASGANVALSWNSAEGATYKVESSPDNSTWTTLSSAVTSGGLTTTYTATTATTYYRVTLTAIATYDTGGTYGTPVGKTATATYGTVPTAPAITTQPASATVTAGSSVSFSVVASGTATLSYQWKKNGTAISGATSATYTIASPATTDAGSYTVTVTNSAGSVTSNAATLTVNAAVTAPSITSQPASVSVTTGSSVTLAVVAGGTSPFTYQWSKNGANISGATSASYTVASAQSSDAGTYAVVVTNSVGSVTSSNATITISSSATAPTIATQPTNTEVTTGAAVTFTVVANGTAPLSYQWRKDGAAISGATSASYVVASAQAGDAGSYVCVVTNSVGSATTNAATLAVTSATGAPVITTQPSNVTVATSAGASFSVVASGTAPFTYQWSKGGTAISGATSATYTIASAQASDAGSYTCTVTNGAGTATSSAATLSVTASTTSSAALSAGIVNLAVRARIGGESGTPIIGIVLGGAGTGKRLVVRAVGPTLLASFGLTGALADPQLQLWSGSTVVASNDNWLQADAAAMTAAGAFPLNAGSGDAAIVQTLTPGTYTTPVSAPAGQSGIVLVEAYDGATADTSARLINASARAFVGTGEDVLIPGFVIAGEGTVRMIVRAVGPGLAQFGVPGTLADPQITLYSGSTAVASNDDWGTANNAAEVAPVSAQAGAFALQSGSKDAVLLVSLSAGAYTAIVRGAGATTGTVLVELYVVR